MRLDISPENLSNNHTSTKSLIKGQIRHDGVPISCEVVVLDRTSKAVYSRVRSKVDGSFVAWGSHAKYNIIMATDPYNDHNIASQDNVK